MLLFADDVIQRGELFQPDEAIDSIVFRRSVYYMANYTGQDGRVIDQNTNTTINCTRRRYQGTDVFNISSNVVENSTVRHDKNTFLCLSMWPNGTDRVRPEAINVKCMPQNGEFFSYFFHNIKSFKLFIKVLNC